MAERKKTMKGGPQKWRWFLEDEGLLSHDTTSSNNNMSDPVTTSFFLDDSLLMVDSNQESIPIERALRWLESAQNHFLPALASSLERAMTQLQVAEATLRFRQEVVQRHQAACSLLRRDNDTCHVLDEDHLQSFWAKHRSLFQDVTKHYMHVVCQQQHQTTPPKGSLQILPALLSDADNTLLSLETLTPLRLDLTELATFCHYRQTNSKPSLFRVSSEDDVTGRLREWEQQLKLILEDEFLTMSKKKVGMVSLSTGSDDYTQNSRLESSRMKLVAAEQAQRESKEIVLSKQEEFIAARTIMMDLKGRLECEISNLLDGDLISIQLEGCS